MALSRMEFSAPLIVAIAVAAIALVGIRLARIGKRESFLPPGPSTLPVLGNLHQLPLAFAHIQFTKWWVKSLMHAALSAPMLKDRVFRARQYGPIYSLKAASNTIVVITGAREAKELLDRRSGVTSDRPPLHVANELSMSVTSLLVTVLIQIVCCAE